MIDVYATPLFVRPDWYDRANCAGVGPRAFFGERGESTAQARVMCAACETRLECLDLALERGELFGVWGGETPRQRTLLRRANRLTRQGRYAVGPRRPQAHNRMETTPIATLDEWPS